MRAETVPPPIKLIYLFKEMRFFLVYGSIYIDCTEQCSLNFFFNKVKYWFENKMLLVYTA
jgi:hypothetical protein